MSPDAGKVPPPEHLSAEARRLWERIVEGSTIDAAAEAILRTLCDAYDQRERARAAMREGGPVIKDRFGVEKVSPWFAVERDSAGIMHRAFRLLGFDQEPRGGGDQGDLFR